MGEMRSAYDILVGKPERKRPLEDIGVDGKVILEWILGWVGVDWMNLVQDRDQWRDFVNTVTNLRVP
jgi:hypothetical protein